MNDNCNCNCDSNFTPADLADPDNSVYRGLRADYPGYFNSNRKDQSPTSINSSAFSGKAIPFKKVVKGFIILVLAGFLSSIVGILISFLGQII